ncbi:hypothetical protein AX16_006048 [Volvariella volvacea WC 439]|nr:hypothetical protein AX16_006048 [Volvariella volvacea WC 439]
MTTRNMIGQANCGNAFDRTPPEIIGSIGEYLDKSSLTRLRRETRRINASISPLALRSIRVPLEDPVCFVRLFLRNCSGPLPHLYQNARNLTVRTCAGWDTCKLMGDTRLEDLYTAIERCTAIRSLTLYWYSRGEKEEVMEFIQEIQERIAAAVLKGTDGKLEKLELEPIASPQYALPRAILQFKRLHLFNLVLEGHRWCKGLDSWGWGEIDEHADLTEHDCIQKHHKKALQVVIRNNPQLEELHIVQSCAIEFHDAGILSPHANDENGQSLALHTLTISGIKFSSVLELSFRQTATPSSPSTLFVHSSRQFVDIPTSGRSDVEDTDDLSSELVIENLEKEPESAALFFGVALPRHASSLTNLSISFQYGVEYLDGWSFTPSLWMPALRSLSVLRTLHLFPGTGDSLLTPESDGLSRYEVQIFRSYQEVLDNICKLKDLKILEIFWPNQKFIMEETYGDWITSSCETVGTVAQHLKAKSGAPPALKLLTTTYSPERLKGITNMWRYI